MSVRTKTLYLLVDDTSEFVSILPLNFIKDFRYSAMQCIPSTLQFFYFFYTVAKTKM